MIEKELDQLALEVAKVITDGEDQSWRGHGFTLEFASRYRAALLEKMEPACTVSGNEYPGASNSIDKLLVKGTRLYSLEDWR